MQPKAQSHSINLRHAKRSDSFSGPDLKIHVRDVSDSHSKKRAITVKTWSTVKDVKDVIHELLSIPPSLQRLYFGPFMTSGVSLPNHRSLCDAGIYKNGQVLYLEIKGLPNNSSNSTLHSSSQKSSHTFDLSTLKHVENDICISKAMFDSTLRPFKSIIKQCRIALAYGIKPVLVLDGSGGTYFLHDIHKRKLAVFKPADEEPYAVNNPRGYVKSGSAGTSGYGFMNSNDYEEEDDNMSMRAGIKPGEACLREVAAYLLDKDGFSGVPMTTLVEARHHAFHSNDSMLSPSMLMASSNITNLSSLASTSTSITQSASTSGSSSLSTPIASSTLTTCVSTSPSRSKKVGSCQEFISSEFSMDDLSPSKLGIEEVQKIAILDIRILNADRNSANLLCRRNPENPDTFELIPIDHGYCLRTVADVCWFDWCWLDWPQLKQPLSKRMKDYVLGLDIEKDVRILREQLDIPKDALDYFRASSTLLQQGVKAGLTLYEIAILCCRNDDAGERPSKLETIISMAADIAKSAVDNGRWHHAAASRALEQQLTPENGYLASRPSKVIHGSHSRRASDGLSIFKSASSVNFSSFNMNDLSQNAPGMVLASFNSSDLSQKDNGEYDITEPLATSMAHSSGSESSSDGAAEEEEEEEEECEKWAVDVIAETLDYAIAPSPVAVSRRQRAISFVNSDSSDDSSNGDESSQLSKSPQGFWFIPPSASKFDEDTAVWSPEASPNSSHHKNGFDFGRDRSVKFHDAAVLQHQPSGISAPMLPLSLGEADNGSNTMHHDDAKENVASDDGNDFMSNFPELPLLPAPGMIKRSQSYSAFSFKRISDSITSNTAAARASQVTTSTDEYEKYYQKFIALLVDREATRAR